MRKIFVAVWPALCCGRCVFAADAEDKQVSLTIYNKNLALIEHVRPITRPPAGSAWNSRASRRRSCRRP